MLGAGKTLAIDGMKSALFTLLAASAVLALGNTAALADAFGTTGNEFTIDFVNIGNAGNADDNIGYGAVPYAYRSGVTEISQDMITKATASGLTDVTAGAWAGSQPAANITWYEAAAFVNWMNTSTGHQKAYDLTYSGSWSMGLWSSADAWQTGGTNLYRHKDAYYVLPSEDEWYKAAYYDPNKSGGAGYWNYATGSDTAPGAVASGTGAGTAVYGGGSITVPAGVDDNGGLSPYGTRGQNGNVWEWSESAFISPNDSSSENRAVRSGYWNDPELSLRSSVHSSSGPSNSSNTIGFRVASVPEPSAALLVLMAGGGWLVWKRRKAAR